MQETAAPLTVPDWDAIIAYVCHMTGWTWDYVESTLTVPRLRALQKEWLRHPPLPLMVAAYLGIKPKEMGTPEQLIMRLGTMPGVHKPNESK